MLTHSEKRSLLHIYILSHEGKPVRSIDLANALSVSRSSVVKMLRRLLKQDLIEQERYGEIYLTPSGISEANQLFTKYTILYEFFHRCLHVPLDVARQDAISCLCGLSEESTEKITKLMVRFSQTTQTTKQPSQ